MQTTLEQYLVKSPQESLYESSHVRLSVGVTDEFKESTIKWINEIVKPLRYLIGWEITHCHIYMEHDVKDEMMKGSKFQKLRALVREQFTPKTSGKLSYSISLARNSKSLKSYVLKDGHFTFSGFTKDDVNLLFKVSHQKGRDQFKKQLDTITELYMKNSIDLEEFYTQFITLKTRFNQNINFRTIDSFIVMIYYKKYPNEIIYEVRTRIQNLGLENK